MSVPQSDVVVHRYFAFGVGIESDKVVPELMALPADQPIGISIHHRQVPRQLETPLVKGVGLEVGDDEFLFHMEGVARYHVQNGQRIDIEAHKDADERAVRLFLLGPVMATLGLWRNVLPFKASCVEQDGQATMLMSGPGRGKSTYAALLSEHGYRLMADDFCWVDFREGRPWVLPSYPRLKLWPETVRRIGWRQADCEPVRSGLDKLSCDVTDRFTIEPAPLRQIVHIGTNVKERAFDVAEASGKGKLLSLMRDTYQHDLFQQLNKGMSHLQRCGWIAKHTPLIRFKRPDSRTPLAQVLEHLVDVLDHGRLAPAPSRAPA